MCGFNPVASADDTLVVGRVTADGEGRVLGTVVNYACHPTTLAWDNTLISRTTSGRCARPSSRHRRCTVPLPPGRLRRGSARRTSTSAIRQSPTSTGAVSASARSPRSRGCSPPARPLRYDGVVESGAPLAVWLPAPFEPSHVLDGGLVDVPLPVKPMPSLEELRGAARGHRGQGDRRAAFFKIQIVRNLNGGDHGLPAWVWRVGDSLLVALRTRRTRSSRRIFAPRSRRDRRRYEHEQRRDGLPLPPGSDGIDLYQVWQTPFSKEALPTLTESCIGEGRRLFASS